jgi:Fic family protein
MQHKTWNWQQDDWSHFAYDTRLFEGAESKFLVNAGLSFGISKHVSEQEKQDIVVKLISNEAYKTSEIEGELLDRDSLQSSIKRHFGYHEKASYNHPRENGIAEMMIDLHHHFDTPLSHETLWSWHLMLMSGRRDLNAIGCYRAHEEPMQVVSGYIHRRKVHFEAPPSATMDAEMTTFIDWFNATSPSGENPLSALTRASIAHLYFVSIHPFEDGNGRIGRALVEKALAQNLKQPTLIALSQIIQDNKKHYYDALEKHNKHNNIDGWINYFADVLLQAQAYTVKEMEFLIEKTKFFDQFKDQMNARQQKVIARIFAEGTKGFIGGLSAKNYVTIAQTTPSTATRDLQSLVEMGALIKTGSRKSTRYYLRIKDD